jgi:hypothetical protein
MAVFLLLQTILGRSPFESSDDHHEMCDCGFWLIVAVSIAVLLIQRDL